MPAIRPIALGLPVRDGHVLLQAGSDRSTGETFHRPLGGGIEFGETAEAAVRREFAEELGVTLADVAPLGVVENVFEFEGDPGHEIAFVFAVSWPGLEALPLDAELRVLDEGSPIEWVDLADPGTVYPEAALGLLSRRRGTTGR